MKSLIVFLILTCLYFCNANEVKAGIGQTAPAAQTAERVGPTFDFESIPNAKNHLTDRYKFEDHNKHLILRRGFNFSFLIHWNRDCDVNDQITLILKLLTFRGNNKHSVIIVANQVSNEINNGTDDWSTTYTCDNRVGNVNVNIAKNASIGSFGLIVQEKHKGNTRQYVAHRNLGIVFNPYLKGEVVYKENGLDEYIENDIGTIYMGKEGKKSHKSWLFGQYEPIVINATFYALNKCNLTAEDRSSPVEVSRALSAISNDYDDWGILIGRWDGDYNDVEVNTSATTSVTLHATPPTRWFGSVAILQQFRETQLPVPYGQCWVYAGLITTMMRTLGIPSRPVTCYSCGHDTNNNLMIDYYLDKNGKTTNKTKDSVWNYHVWVQAYMRRLDLSSNAIFDGWQDVDGTPQEKSGNKFQMGPTPVNAVKIGMVDAQFDLPFVFSEVNADIVWWKEESILIIETSKIGTSIITKDKGANTARDITGHYKAKEKSKLERQTLQRIVERLGLTHPAFNSSIRQRSLETKHINAEILCKDSINLGEGLPIRLKLKPESYSAYNRKTKKVEYTLTVKTMHYDGHESKEVKTEVKDVQIKSPKAVYFETILTPEMYEDSTDYSSLRITVAIKDIKTGALAVVEKDVDIKLPELKFTLKGQTRDKRFLVMSASFTNPLSITATNCAFSFESQAMERKEVTVKYLKAKQTASANFTIKTPKRNNDLVMVSFACDQIQASEAEYRVYSKSNVKH